MDLFGHFFVPFHFITDMGDLALGVHGYLKTLFGAEIAIAKKVPFTVCKKELPFVRFPFGNRVDVVQ